MAVGMLVELPGFVDPWAALARWPADRPLCFFGGQGSRFAILPIAFSEISFEDVDRLPLRGDPSSGDRRVPFQTGYMGLLSYDDFVSHCGNSRRTSRVLQVDASLIFDCRFQKLWRSSNGRESRCTWRLEEGELDRLLRSGGEMPGPIWAASLECDRSGQHYLGMVGKALEDIRNGRYYQANLLRYFRVNNTPSYSELLGRMSSYSGPQSVMLRLPGLSLASFSPERFIRLVPDNSDLVAVTEPIKGTAPRADDSQVDKQLAVELRASHKDNAELHMIVDLMRNDLGRISHGGSVKVEDPGSLHSFTNVHHLVARVTSRLRSDITLGGFCGAVCPGGSITGAPKIEVMKAIREYEGRERCYFMGNAFYLDASGAFDSSILIRTMVADGWTPEGATSENTYEFAAGSGIVIGSDPLLELEEVAAKSAVVAQTGRPATTAAEG